MFCSCMLLLKILLLSIIVFDYFSFMRLNKILSVTMFLLLCFISILLKAQYEDSTTIEKKVDKWKKGYIVLENHTDTLTGYLKLKEFEYGYIEEVSFRKDKDKKKGTIVVWGDSKNEIRFLGFESKRYKYFNFTDDSIPTKRFQNKNSFTGWVEIIEEGPINITLGLYVKSVVPTNPGMMLGVLGEPGVWVGSGEIRRLYTPMYCLKKGNKPTIIIEGPSSTNSKWDNLMLHELDERNKNHFFNFISDNIELVNEYKNKEVFFGNIEMIIREYNIWSKNNNK